MSSLFRDTFHSGSFMKIAAAAVLCLSLAGCGVTHEYKRPDTALPADYRGTAASVSGKTADTTIAAIPYRKFFNDPALLALIDSAAVRNYDLLIALKNIDYAHESLRSARLGNLPTLSLGVNASDTKYSENSLTAQSTSQLSVNNYTAALSTSWEVDIWAKIRNRSKSALADYLRSKDAANAVKTRLVSDVAQGYYNLLMLDNQLSITRKNMALADTTLTMVRLQYDAGNVTSLAVQQQESLRQSSAISIPKLEQAVAAQETALSILTGRMPGSIQRDAASLQFAVKDDLPIGIPAALLQYRPDVRAAEAALMSAHASVGVAKANLYPSLTITAQGGLNSFKVSNWFNTPGSLFGIVQGGLLQPILQHGELKAKYEQSRISRDQSELAFKQMVLKAVGEVTDALVRLDKVKQQEILSTERVKTLNTAIGNADMLFRSGMATYLEVMTAQNSALQAQLELADLHRQHLGAMAELYRALGGGWQ